MNAIGSFIVSPLNNKLYNNERFVGNNSYLVDSNIESHECTNRFAIVESLPAGYTGEVLKGDLVVVHHNVFRKVNDIRGKEMYSSGMLKDNYYLADDVEVYAFKRENNWHSIDPYSFIKPVKSESSIYDNNHEVTQLGIVEIGNKTLQSIGVFPGDRVYFQPDSEYEFNIDGVKLYRMKSSNICLKI